MESLEFSLGCLLGTGADVAANLLEVVLSEEYARVEEIVPGVRRIRLAERGGLTYLSDQPAGSMEDWPEGDPTTSMLQLLSVATPGPILYLFQSAGLWGYFLYRHGLIEDRFVTEPRIFSSNCRLDYDDTDALFRGRPESLARLAQDGADLEAIITSLAPGGLLDLMRCLGMEPVPREPERQIDLILEPRGSCPQALEGEPE